MMNNKVLGYDVDGVLRDLMTGVNAVFKTHYPDHVIGEIAYNYDFPHINMPLEEKYDIIFNKYPEDIFLNTKPYSDAVSQFCFVKKWAKENNVKLVCATMQEPHLMKMTYSWLKKHEFKFDAIYNSRNKGNLGLTYLLDDAPHNYMNWLKNKNPEENFFLMDRDWNQETSCENRVSSAYDMIKIIESKW